MALDRADDVDTAVLTNRLMDDVYPEFSTRLASDVVESVIRSELERWEGSKVRDFVPLFAARHVRSKLRSVD